MRSIFLTGLGASQAAERLFTAARVRPAGFRLLPLTTLNGQTRPHDRGELLHLLMQPPAPMENDVPCVLRLSAQRRVLVRETLEEIAAPALTMCAQVRSPLLLDGISGEMLTCPAFREAVRSCVRLDSLALCILRDQAAADVLTEPGDAVYDVPASGDDAVQEALLRDALMRW